MAFLKFILISAIILAGAMVMSGILITISSVIFMFREWKNDKNAEDDIERVREEVDIENSGGCSCEKELTYYLYHMIDKGYVKTKMSDEQLEALTIDYLMGNE